MSVERMYQLFEKLDYLIERLSKGSSTDEQLLETFCFHLFTILDGLEDFEGCHGLSLVDKDVLPENVEEINDDFLHDAWADHRKQLGRGGSADRPD